MKKIAVLTGAGISAESGIQTFRDHGGLWEGYDVEDVATIDAWYRNPKLVLDFYNWRSEQVRKVQPNYAHIFLAEAQNKYHINIITQNVDDLHERAGSEHVMHLHGELTKMCSEKDKSKTYPYNEPIQIGDLAEDGGQLRPFIVWFGEDVPKMTEAIDVIMQADVVIVIGTSLVVYPAAGLVNYRREGTQTLLLDKSLPENMPSGVQAIEKPATEGIEDIFDLID